MNKDQMNPDNLLELLRSDKIEDYNNPWEVPGLPYHTEAGYFSFLRGLLRKGWSRHAVKTAFVKANRKRVNKGLKGREVWGGTCAVCKQDFHSKDLQVDHKRPAGSCRTYEELAMFTKNLFHVTPADLQFVCKPCHRKLTNMDRTGYRLDQMDDYDKLVKFKAMKAAQQKEWLTKRNTEPGKTGKVRVEQAKKLLGL